LTDISVFHNVISLIGHFGVLSLASHSGFLALLRIRQREHRISQPTPESIVIAEVFEQLCVVIQ
jgi:hypothetical protein